MTCWRRLRDWNDARVFDQLHQLPLARRGPTEPAWFASVHMLYWAIKFPYRGAFRCNYAPSSGRLTAAETGRTVPGAQAQQHTAGDVSPKGSRPAAAVFAMHHAGYPM
jgi:hypothetical protein